MQLEPCTDEANFRSVALRNCFTLAEAGVIKPAHRLTLEDKPGVIRSLTTNHILRCKTELDQFREGLQDLDVAEIMSRNKANMRPLFMAPDGETLTAGKTSTAIFQTLASLSTSTAACLAVCNFIPQMPLGSSWKMLSMDRGGHQIVWRKKQRSCTS